MNFSIKGRLALGAGLLCVGALAIYVTMEPGRPQSVSTPAAHISWPDFAATKAGAEAGDARAQALFAKMHAEGHGTPRDYAAAARLYRLAAAQGHADGQHGLAELCEAGQGVPLDYAAAAQWYRRAAEQGHVSAQFGLAVMYEFGRGVAKDQAEAALWYRRAAEQGEAQAQYNLGQRCSLALGVAADPVEAYKWFRLAAAQGLPDAAKAGDAMRTRLSREEFAEARRRVDSFTPSGRAAFSGK